MHPTYLLALMLLGLGSSDTTLGRYWLLLQAKSFTPSWWSHFFGTTHTFLSRLQLFESFLWCDFYFFLHLTLLA